MKVIGDSGSPCFPMGEEGLKASGNLDVITFRYQFPVPSDASPLTSVTSTRCPVPLRSRSCSAAQIPASSSWLAP
jgi:hypothetical protein